MDTGWNQRLAILRDDAKAKLLEPLRIHGWLATVVREVQPGEYLIIEAERAGQRHRVALLYTSATANTVYKQLAAEVEHIFLNGEPYKLEAYAHGISTPISSADDFQLVLVRWNEASSSGKFAPSADDVVVKPVVADHRVLLSEVPIDAVWLRLRQLQSTTLARRLIQERFERANVAFSSDTLHSKSEGLAYALRNASDYFKVREERNVSQRVLNFYYGSMAFAAAEMLALPAGPAALSDIEASTKLGHGLGMIDGETDGMERLIVFPIASGFFPRWLSCVGVTIDKIVAKKPKTYADLDRQMPYVTVEQLLSRIPEIGDLFLDIFDSAPGWVIPTFSQTANRRASFRSSKSDPIERTYVELVDESARFTNATIAKFPGPLSEIIAVVSDGPGLHFRAAVDHPGKQYWQQALSIHHSPFLSRGALIEPIFGSVAEFRAIVVALLYALSIVVRYRPSLWRRVQEGDLDHMRVLVEAFLSVAERILPQQFLERITDRRVFAKQPGQLW